PMGTMEARSFQRTATPRTPSIKRPRQGQWELYKLRKVARGLPHQAFTVGGRWAKQQVGTSTRRQTAMSTRTPGAVGIKLTELLNPPQATQGPTLPLLAAMQGRKEVAGPLPLAEAVGNPGRRVLVVRTAAVAVVVGEVAGEGNGAGADEVTLVRG
ncbi:MAG TPA: hypothetical protein VK638_03490, partial [Edaphobacter sp.]|nr:hypothetical protein [Edaphobacter sp.]